MWRHSIRRPLTEEQAEVSRSLAKIVWILMAATPLLLVGLITLPQHSTRWLVLFGFIYVLCISTLILNRRAHTQLAGIVLVVGLWVLLTGAALTAGGMSSFAPTFYVMIVFIAGLLFDQRAAITTAILCILTAFALVVMEATGTINSTVLPYTPLARWTAITILTVIVIGLQYLSVRRVNDALERTRRELDQRRRTEAKFRVLAETAGSVILIYQDGKYRYANPAAETIIGYSQEEILKMSLAQLVHPDFRELIESRALARERGENVPSRYEVKIVNKKGDERWLDAAGNWMEFEGKPARLVTAFDITERKLAEEQLLFSREQLRALSERLRRAKEEEGARIARELHDELGSALPSLKWSLLDLKKADPANNEKIVDMVGLVDETINVVRRISSELRPDVLDDPWSCFSNRMAYATIPGQHRHRLRVRSAR